MRQLLAVYRYSGKEQYMDTVEYHGKTITIEIDENPEDPREWDNLGTMVCFHKRYTLGDKHDYDSDMFSGWDEMEEFITSREDVAVILPLSLYDHSGITMHVGRSHGWDSGQVGFIFVSKAKVRKEYKVKRISAALLKRVTGYLENEVEIYDQYLTGQVYAYSTDTGDSCAGYYDVKQAIADARDAIDYTLEQEAKEHEKRLKQYIKGRVPLQYRFI